MNRGSLPRREVRWTSLSSFNEAPIHESGKCVEHFPFLVVAGEASMRPRFMNRGSDTVDQVILGHPLLQ